MIKNDSEDPSSRLAGCVMALPLILLVFLLLLVVGGRQRTEVVFELGPSGMSQASTVRTIEGTFTARHWLGGWIQGRQPDPVEFFREQLEDGETILRLTVGTRRSASDLLFRTLTLRIYTPVTVDLLASVSSAGSPATKTAEPRR